MNFELGYFFKNMAQSLTEFGDRTEIIVHFKFCYNEQIFFTCKYVKVVVPWVYLIRTKFIFVYKMKCIPSNESCGKAIFYL